MIIQPEWGTRNVNKYFYESEARRVAELNEIFGEVELTVDEERTLIWLAGWAEYTIENVLSAIRKAMAVEAKRLEASGRTQWQLLMDGTAVKSAFALLLTKVTKPAAERRKSVLKEYHDFGGDDYQTNNQFYVW